MPSPFEPEGCNIIVRDGIYEETINFQGNAVTVSSENGAEHTVIKGHSGEDVF